MILPGTTAPFFTTGTAWMALIARIQASGGLMIAVNSSTPNIPILEIVNVLPSQSAGCSFLLLRPLCQILYFDSDLRQAFRIGKPNHRHQQSVVDRYRHTDIDMVIDPDLVPQPTAVDRRVLLNAIATAFSTISLKEIFTGDTSFIFTRLSITLSISMVIVT